MMPGTNALQLQPEVGGLRAPSLLTLAAFAIDDLGSIISCAASSLHSELQFFRKRQAQRSPFYTDAIMSLMRS